MMSNYNITKKHISLVVIIAMCATMFIGVSTASAQDAVVVQGSKDGDVDTVDNDVDIDTDDEDDADEFNLPSTLPGHWTADDLDAYFKDLEKNKKKKLFLKSDGEPKFIGVAANNGFSRGNEGLITEDEIQDGTAPLISAPEFTKKNVRKITYALTEENSCEDVKYKSTIPTVGDLKKDGMYYICVKAKKGRRVWEIPAPMVVVRNTVVKGFAFVGSDPVDCREVSEERWITKLQGEFSGGPYFCVRDKQKIKHDNGTIGIGGARHELYKITAESIALIKVWKDREIKDYLWPVPTN